MSCRLGLLAFRDYFVTKNCEVLILGFALFHFCRIPLKVKICIGEKMLKTVLGSRINMIHHDNPVFFFRAR